MAIALSVAFAPSPLGLAEKIRIRATPQLSAGVAFVPKSRYKDVFLGAAATATPSNILAAYTALFGALVSGKKIFFEVSTVNAQGFQSTPVESSIIVT